MRSGGHEFSKLPALRIKARNVSTGKLHGINAVVRVDTDAVKSGELVLFLGHGVGSEFTCREIEPGDSVPPSARGAPRVTVGLNRGEAAGQPRIPHSPHACDPLQLRAEARDCALAVNTDPDVAHLVDAHLLRSGQLPRANIRD